MKRIVLFLVSSAVLLFGVSAPAQAAPKSIKLKKAQFKNVGPYQCGQVKGAWVPGINTKSTKTARYFIPFTAYAADETKKAKKVKGKSKSAVKKRAAFEKKAANFTTRANQQASTCASGVYSYTPPLMPNQRYCENKPLLIDLNGARGLAVTGSSSGGVASGMMCVPRAFVSNRSIIASSGEVSPRFATNDSNLFTVGATGALRQAFNAQVNVRGVLASPTGDVYVTFNQRTNVTNLDAPYQSGSGCVLARVNRADGTLTCIDTVIDYMSWGGGWFTSANPSIQFTPDGSLYYTGYINSGSSQPNYVLRKYQGGVATTVVNGGGNFQINDFAVLHSGDVAVKGWTTSTGTNWFRMFWGSGGFATINGNGHSEFMRVLSDGNLYFSSNGWSGSEFGQGGGIHRLNLLGNKELSTTKFLANCSNTCGVAPVIDAAAACFSAGETSGPCSTSGSFSNTVSLRLQDGSNYLVSEGVVYKLSLGSNPGITVVATPGMNSVSKVQAAGNNIVLLGNDNSGRQRLELLNPGTGTETKLLPSGSEEIDLFHMSYRGSDNQLFANLLSSRDGNIYVAQIDLGSGSVSYAQSLTAKLEDLLAFTD